MFLSPIYILEAVATKNFHGVGIGPLSKILAVKGQTTKIPAVNKLTSTFIRQTKVVEFANQFHCDTRYRVHCHLCSGLDLLAITSIPHWSRNILKSTYFEVKFMQYLLRNFIIDGVACQLPSSQKPQSLDSSILVQD